MHVIPGFIGKSLTVWRKGTEKYPLEWVLKKIYLRVKIMDM